MASSKKIEKVTIRAFNLFLLSIFFVRRFFFFVRRSSHRLRNFH